MAAPNMAIIAASLERSFQNCSLNHQSSSNSSSGSSSTAGGGGGGANSAANVPDTALELNSETALPFHWEQCLDLKTGEIYYINWRIGMKVTEDPRTMVDYSEEEDDDRSFYDSDESSSESSPAASSREQWSGNNTNNPESLNNENSSSDDVPTNVLVVAGCKSCLMYYMVPKQLGICPKCCGQLLHFDSDSSSS